MSKRDIQDAVLTAVRAYCLECSGGSRKEAEGCNRSVCPLHPYRMGRAVLTEPVRTAVVPIDGQVDIFSLLSNRLLH